jgi:MFS transporter, DHA2 family, multidrug resistance protein
VAEAVTIPLTGYLSDRFGRRNVLLAGIAGFVATSALCGLATSIDEIVVFRLLQGVSGAPLIPLSQGVMVNTFPPTERGKAMAIWGIGVMLAPVLGPTVGGFITEHLSWRWVFYINLPVGLLNLALVAQLIPKSPHQPRPLDWPGAIYLIGGIGALQAVLDRGNQEDWWSSNLIKVLTIMSVCGLVLFVVRALRAPEPIVDLRLLRDRNLVAASTMMLVFGLGLFGTVAMQPLLLERLLGYPAETTGLVMAPRALGSAASMALVGRLTNRVDARWLVGTGMLLAGTGTWMMSWYNLQISPSWVVWPGVVQGLGMGAVFVPLSTMAYATLRPDQTDAAAGLFNLARTIGSAVGISIAATWLTRFTQENWHHLGGHINVFNPALQYWLDAQGLSLEQAVTPLLLRQELITQATMLAFVQVFRLIALSFLVMSPMLLLLRTGPRRSRSAHPPPDGSASPTPAGSGPSTRPRRRLDQDLPDVADRRAVPAHPGNAGPHCDAADVTSSQCPAPNLALASDAIERSPSRKDIVMHPSFPFLQTLQLRYLSSIKCTITTTTTMNRLARVIHEPSLGQKDCADAVKQGMTEV